MKRFLCILVVVFATLGSAHAQRSALADYNFGNYLIGKGLLRDALTLTHTLADDYTPAALDTMRYLRGWTLYHSKQFAPAADAFAQVGTTSSLYAKSALFGVVCDVESGNIEGAKQRLDTFATTPTGELHREIVAFERGGLALLEGDKAEYERQRQHFSYSSPTITEYQHTLDRIADTPIPHRSPLVAGLASAVVPGLGKIYAGDLGGGVASFLLVGAFAALTAESWHKAGTPQNWRTITYGTIGSLLYVSNIFGSVASVKAYYQNFEEINRQAVMVSIHIPLRNIFD